MNAMQKTAASRAAKDGAPAFRMSAETEGILAMLVEFDGLANRLFAKAEELGWPSSVGGSDGETELLDAVAAMKDTIGAIVMASVCEQLSNVRDVPTI